MANIPHVEAVSKHARHFIAEPASHARPVIWPMAEAPDNPEILVCKGDTSGVKTTCQGVNLFKKEHLVDFIVTAIEARAWQGHSIE